MTVTQLTGFLTEAKTQHTTFAVTAPTHAWEDYYAAYVVARLNGHNEKTAATVAGQRAADNITQHTKKAGR